jgi:cation diffusion facilitator family transporter
MDSQQSLSPEKKAFLRKWVVLISAFESLLETGIKLVAALLTGSTGLLADFIHSSIDVVGSLLVWVGVQLAPRKYSRFPYGFYKIENLLALAIGLAIIYGAYEIFLVFLSGKSPLPTNLPIGIGAVILGMLMDFFWGRFEARTGRLLNSPGIEASGNHTVSDVLSSSVVLAGLVGALFGYNLDRWAALVVAILITRMGMGILWDNLRVLLDINMDAEKLEGYRKLIERQPGVREVRQLRGRNSGSFRFVDAEILVNAFEVEAANAIADQVEAALKAYDETIDSAFIHYRHALPTQLNLFVPTDDSGKRISECFGKSSHFTFIRYDRNSRSVLERTVELNPYSQNEEHRGIHLASYLIDRGADSICCREDLREKGPGLMMYRFGVDVRYTANEALDEVLEDYLGRSESMFSGSPEVASKPA